MANDLWHDMKVLNSLYEELMWNNQDDIQFRIEDERIVIRNVTVCLLYTSDAADE